MSKRMEKHTDKSTYFLKSSRNLTSDLYYQFSHLKPWRQKMSFLREIILPDVSYLGLSTGGSSRGLVTYVEYLRRFGRGVQRALDERRGAKRFR